MKLWWYQITYTLRDHPWLAAIGMVGLIGSIIMLVGWMATTPPQHTPERVNNGTMAVDRPPDAMTGATPDAMTGASPDAMTGASPDAMTGATPDAMTGATPDPISASNPPTSQRPSKIADHLPLTAHIREMIACGNPAARQPKTWQSSSPARQMALRTANGIVDFGDIVSQHRITALSVIPIDETGSIPPVDRDCNGVIPWTRIADVIGRPTIQSYDVSALEITYGSKDRIWIVVIVSRDDPTGKTNGAYVCSNIINESASAS